MPWISKNNTWIEVSDAYWQALRSTIKPETRQELENTHKVTLFLPADKNELISFLATGTCGENSFQNNDKSYIVDDDGKWIYVPTMIRNSWASYISGHAVPINPPKEKITLYFRKDTQQVEQIIRNDERGEQIIRNDERGEPIIRNDNDRIYDATIDEEIVIPEDEVNIIELVNIIRGDNIVEVERIYSRDNKKINEILNCNGYNLGTSLLLAINSNSWRVAAWLIEKGADLKIRNDNEKTLHYLCVIKNVTESCELLSKLCDKSQEEINMYYNEGKTLLHIAVENVNLEMVKVLVKKGGLNLERQSEDINEKYTPINYALQNGHHEIAEYLISIFS